MKKGLFAFMFGVSCLIGIGLWNDEEPVEKEPVVAQVEEPKEEVVVKKEEPVVEEFEQKFYDYQSPNMDINFKFTLVAENEVQVAIENKTDHPVEMYFPGMRVAQEYMSYPDTKGEIFWIVVDLDSFPEFTYINANSENANDAFSINLKEVLK